MSNIVVRSEVKETLFGFYTDEDIKSLSVCRVISPETLNEKSEPVPGYVMFHLIGNIVELIISVA